MREVIQASLCVQRWIVDRCATEGCTLFAEGSQHSMTERPSHAYSTTRAWRVGSVGDASTAA